MYLGRGFAVLANTLLLLLLPLLLLVSLYI